MSGHHADAFDGAKTQLARIMATLSPSHRDQLLAFAIKNWMPRKYEDFSEEELSSRGSDEGVLDDPASMLTKIVEDIRERIPFEAVLPSENIIVPTTGPFNDCDPKITVHVDGFLYDDDDVDQLVADGKLSRHYCKDCGSKKIDSLIYISHSSSRDELYHIFNDLLPTLDGKVVVDVGSRLGALLYGAFVYTDAAKIIGVEMNKDLCDLQNEVIRKYKMDSRVEIINRRIEDAADVLEEADVVILNNVFSFYLSEPEQNSVWEFLQEHIKTGALIISRPSLSEGLSHLNTTVDVNSWVEMLDSEISGHYFDAEGEDEQDEFPEIYCYRVL